MKNRKKHCNLQSLQRPRIVILAMMVSAVPVWASVEPYTEEPIDVPVCKVQVLKRLKNKKLIEYVFQNEQQTKNTSPFWVEGAVLSEDFCKIGDDDWYEADDIVVTGKNDLVVWDEQGNTRVVGSYDDKGEKTGIWRTYHANGYLDLERKIRTYEHDDSSLTFWDDEGDFRWQYYYDTEFERRIRVGQDTKPKRKEICDIHVIKQENGIHLVKYVHQNPQKSKNTTPFWDRKTVLKKTYCLDETWGVPQGYFISQPRMVRGGNFVVWDKHGHKLVGGVYNTSGIRKGVWKAFYANGQLRSQYESGSPDKVEYWYATGQPKIQEKHRYGLTNVWLSDKISIEPDLQIRTKNEDNRMRISQMYDKQDRLVLEIVRDRFQKKKIVSRKEFKYP